MPCISILHLEDSPLDAELVHASLEMAGMTLQVTRVDTEAHYAAAIGASQFDLVLADYSLPSYDGLSALNLLRSQGNHTPFILISGQLGEELAIESLKLGATDYVLKHRLDRLPPAVDRALRESSERAELRRAEQEKDRLVAELAVAYQREKRIAETLQRSFLNKETPQKFAHVKLASIYQAAWEEAQVGGDYFDTFALRGGRVALVVGDVSGKGLNAAARTAELKYALRAYLSEHGDPAVAVQRLNDFLCEGSELDPETHEYFVVLTLVILDPGVRTATVVIAGAEPILVLRGGVAIDQIKVSGMPLGILSGNKYQSAVVELGREDVVLMSTDGLTEARRGGDLLGIEALGAYALECLANPDLQSAANALLARAQEFAGGKLQDDACLLLARFEE